MWTIFNICLGMTCFSGVVLAIKNVAAENKIERSGKQIISDPRSLAEKFISWVKDYGYLLIPVVNVLRTIKLFKTNDLAYAKQRESLLAERERIINNETKVISKPVIKKEIKKEPVVIQNTEKDNELIKLKEERDYYLELDKRLHEQIKLLDEMNCSSEEHNELVDQIIDVQNKYRQVVDDINSYNNTLKLKL